MFQKPYVRSGVLPVINEHHVDCKRQPPTQQHKPYTAKSPGQMTEIQLRVSHTYPTFIIMLNNM